MQALHHLDLSLRPDPEQSADELMSALYQQLHRALVQLRATQIAAAFPEYRVHQANTVGNTLRLIAPLAELEGLMAQPWLIALQDHLRISPAKAVPAHAKPMRLERVQAKTSVERLRRRAIKRHQYSEAEAKERLPDHLAEKRPNLPAIRLQSASTGQSFDLFLRLQAAETETRGHFNTYALSTSATVPWF